MRHVSKQQLSAFVDGALSGVSRELVTRHLAACHSCREKHMAWKAADEALRGALAWTPNERTLEEWSSRVELCLTAERKGLPILLTFSIVSQPIYWALVKPRLRDALRIDPDAPETGAIEHIVRFVRRGLGPVGRSVS